MNGADRHTPMPCPGAVKSALTIGLVNNMPLAACSTTERQFRQILAAAGNEEDVSLRCFRTDAGATISGIDAISEADLDGIIVTGAEPQSSSLREEPIWPLITRLVDWGEEQALPVMWSCLAAHAAILYLDGIDRVELYRKISGLFAGEVVAADHSLLQGLDATWMVPHSRCNDVPEKTLAANGYRILVRSPGAGVDLFQKVSKPDFVFLQSHPEYEADSLRREFHRDLRRFLSGERDEFPTPPQSYFGSIGAALPPIPDDLSSHRRETAEAMLTWLSRSGVQPVQAPWHATAVTFFGNWLRGVAARKPRVEEQRLGFAGHAVHHHELQEPGLVTC
jgi:homoserine O-succinyltransferase